MPSPATDPEAGMSSEELDALPPVVEMIATTTQELKALCYQAAGAAGAALMANHPEVEFDAAEVEQAVERVLKEHFPNAFE